MELKKHIIPNKQNLIFTFVLFILVCFGEWYLTNYTHYSGGLADPTLLQILLLVILTPLGLGFAIINPFSLYRIQHGYAWLLIAALAAELVCLYFLSCLILWLFEKIHKNKKS